MFLTLDRVKEHLNIDKVFHDDDEYLNHLILVAEKVVEKHIDCDFSVLMDEVGMIPAPLLHSMLLFIGDLYQSRESVSFASAQELPLSFRYLLDLYMNYSSDDSTKPDMPKQKPCEKHDHVESCSHPHHDHHYHEENYGGHKRKNNKPQINHSIEVSNIEVI